MNARGSTEVIVASIGLSIGALSQNLYTMIVTMAVLTTSAMPPTLRWALSRVPLRPGEKERLERETFEAKGFVANMERLLVLIGDSQNGRLASRLAGLLAGPRGLPTTVLHVDPEVGSSEERTAAKASEIADNVKQSANQARSTQSARADEGPAVAVKTSTEPSDPGQAVSHEPPKGYDLLIVGLEPGTSTEGFTPAIAKAARGYDGASAVVVAREVDNVDPIGGVIKIPTPITGTAISRRAAEVGIELARAADAEINALYVSLRRSRPMGHSKHAAFWREIMARPCSRRSSRSLITMTCGCARRSRFPTDPTLQFSMRRT